MSDLLVNDSVLSQLSANPGEIQIFHPGYEDKAPLLRFFALDNNGLWREVAETACAIIANNRFDGKLRDENGTDMTENILKPGKYWWHLPDGGKIVLLRCPANIKDVKYPVLTEFRLWSFPETVPAIWRTKETDLRSHERCCVTLQRFGKEKAHIIPKGEAEWFEQNLMGSYCYDNPSNSVDDRSNLMGLRSDIHTGLDQKLFAFFPKNDQIMLHCMARDASFYHNALLRANVCCEFLLARFAWTLFPQSLSAWLKMREARMLWVDNGGTLTAKEVNGAECRKKAYPSTTRSTSSKRHRSDNDNTSVLQPTSSNLKRRSRRSLDLTLGSTQSDSDSCVENWEETRRGRKRLRGDY